MVITLVSLTASSTRAHGRSDSDEIDFLYGFLEGPYHLIGKWPDSNRTYYGKAVLRKADGELEVIRRIEGKEVKAVGKIETATGDKIKVLRIRFTDEKKSYEGTYLIHFDLDNYGRLAGYLYLKEGGTKNPGFEALFIDHQALKENTAPEKAD